MVRAQVRYTENNLLFERVILNISLLCVRLCVCVAVSVVIQRVGVSPVTVAVDGSLYRFHPHFKRLMSTKISQLLPANIQVYS